MKYGRVVKIVLVISLALIPINYTFAGKGYKDARLGVVQDYYDPIDRNFLILVERGHIIEMKERYQKGLFDWVWNDLEYVLRHVPNHPEALQKMISFVDEYIKKTPDDVNEWFDKAVDWNPMEPNTRVLYGIHFYKIKEYEKAEEQFQAAISLDEKHVEAHYNYGLLLLKMGKLEEAKKHAKFAYDNNYPLPGLQNLLAKLKHWP